MTPKEFIAFIRSSKTLGRGSCSHVDEANTDAELLEEIVRIREIDPGMTPRDVWEWLLEMELLLWERANIAWTPIAPSEVDGVNWAS